MPAVDLPEIEWAHTQNVALYHRMQGLVQRISQRLDQLAKQPKQHQGYLPFLRRLISALKAWLAKVKEEWIACEANLKNHRTTSFSRRCYPPEGKFVRAELGRQLQLYESEWRATYEQGGNPDLIPAPSFTKELLANIIRQCPVAAAPGRGKRYDAKWLLENVGTRFIHDADHDSLSSKSVLPQQGLTQDDLVCDDDVWRSLSTGMGLGAFQPPCYFAPVPGLMRARQTLSEFSSVTTPITAGSTGVHTAVHRDEIWQALLSLPTNFVTHLYRQTPWNVDQVIFMMETRPYGKERDEFLRDWEQTLSQMECEDTSPGREIPHHGQEKPAGVSWLARKARPDPSRSIEHELGEHPELMAQLAEAWSGPGFLMRCTKSVVLKLLDYGGRTQHSPNKDVLSIPDVVSVLPDHSITLTALYKIAEAMTIQHPDASVVPLSLLVVWMGRGETPVRLVQRIDSYFTLRDGQVAKTVYILPTFEPVDVLAICQVTPSYCSTMIVGANDALQPTERKITPLLSSVSCWPADFCWGRFHHLPVECDTAQARKKWGFSKSQNLGLVLSGVISKSLSTGCRGLGELLGDGRISWEAPNLADARLKGIYALDLMVGTRLGSEGEELEINHDREVSETADRASDGEHDSDSDGDARDKDHSSNRPDDKIGFNMDRTRDEMARIDMEDDEDIERRIESILNSNERSGLTFTEEHELALLPPTSDDNHAGE